MLLAGVTLLLSGCASSKTAGPARQPITVADFNDPAAPQPQPAAAHSSTHISQSSTPAAQAVPTSPSVPEVSISPGAAVPLEAAIPTGAGTEADAKVGDINGRAIFASSFLDEMSARLRAQAQDLIKRAGGRDSKATPAQVAAMRELVLPVWSGSAQYLIRQKLDNELQVELLRAEAAASFTPEQKMGFFSFIQKVQKDLYSEAGGSATRAGEVVSEQEGKTIDDYLKQRKTLELVRFQLQRKVFSRVNVSWRDIQLDFDRRPDAYIDPPKAFFRVILVKDQAEAQGVEKRLAAGELFLDIAKSPVNTYKTSDGGLEERQLKGKQSETELFGPPALNAAAQKLTEGEWAGPLKAGSSMGFIYLEHIQIDDKTLYDVQLRVEDGLRVKRQELETQRYIERLKTRASFTSLDEMTARLLAFAQKRYFDPLFVD
jgi:hypothetical protein